MFQSVFSFLGVAIPNDILASLGLVLGLIFLDVVMGIFGALTTKTFDANKLANFLETSILPYVGSLLMLGIFAAFIPQIQAIFLPSVAAAVVKFVLDIKNKFLAISNSNLPNSDISNPPIEPQPVPMPAPAVNNVSINTPAADKTVPAEDKPADSQSK